MRYARLDKSKVLSWAQGLIRNRSPTTQTDNTVEVRGGTLETLTMRLLHEATPRLSPEYISDFILTHQTFATTEEVLALLIQKYVVWIMFSLHLLISPPGTMIAQLRRIKKTRLHGCVYATCSNFGLNCRVKIWRVMSSSMPF